MSADQSARSGRVEARGVEFAFGETPALRGASLVAEPGEILAVMGPSGSGKSTLLHCLAGILVPSAGEVHIGGVRIDTMNETQRSALRLERFGFVFQFGQLVPELTAEENVALPLLLAGRRERDALAAADARLDEVDLGPRARARPHTLSGGELQRAAVARALVHEPSLVLADEPTGNLDSRSAAQVVALLASLVRRHGATLLMVTHSRDAAAAADRVVTLEDGRVVGDVRGGSVEAGPVAAAHSDRGLR